jgi:hypothetical protein
MTAAQVDCLPVTRQLDQPEKIAIPSSRRLKILYSDHRVIERQETH